MREMEPGFCLCNPIPFKFLMLLLLIAALGTSVLSVQPTTMFTAVNTTLPGCPRKCGNLTVPYPFGILPHPFDLAPMLYNPCSLSYQYNIICNASYNPPRAFFYSTLAPGTTEVLDMSETQVTVKNNQITSRCRGDKETLGPLVVVANSTAYTFSNNENVLTVVGCHDFAWVRYWTLASTHTIFPYNIGCLAICEMPNDLPTDGTCSGLGCCQTSVPKGFSSYVIDLNVFSNYSDAVPFQRCAFAFLAKRGTFKFHGASDFKDRDAFISRTLDEVPIVFDWTISYYQLENGQMLTNSSISCDDAGKNLTLYACKANTNCIDSDDFGYRCRCRSGYEGNPYLNCTDVNECVEGLDNPCTHSDLCVNTPGGYQCSCNHGFHGDGHKNGTGCVSIPRRAKFPLATVIGSSLGSVIVVLGAVWLYSVVKRKKEIRQRAKYFKRNGGLLLQQEMNSKDGFVEKTRIFTNNELERATDQFNQDRVLGQGGQGTVYKGMLAEGRIVAIKKSKIVEENQLKEFINEVVILSQIDHRNIVKLLGCCLETKVPLLVYEFIPNGSLFHHLHDPSEEFHITWRMRLQISTDMAGALAYLHSSSSRPIYHRDIKSSNILLDEKYRAKLSDFGTSRSIAVDQTHLTTIPIGTVGYIDPEFLQSHLFTEKSDVYSFGVVLVELLTGQKAIRLVGSEDERSLTTWFLAHMEDSSLLDIVDAQVLKEGKVEEFVYVGNLAKLCLSLDRKQRPTMKQVATEIEAIKLLHESVMLQQDLPLNE